MNKLIRNTIDVQIAKLEQTRQESAAKTVPYVSFILTHLALVLFIVTIFLVDRLVTDPPTSTFIKIILVAGAVLSLASEWFYAIYTSSKWKKSIRDLREMEALQDAVEEELRLKEQQALMFEEKQKNLFLLFERQRLMRRSSSAPSSFPMMGDSQPHPSTRTQNSGAQRTIS